MQPLSLLVAAISYLIAGTIAFFVERAASLDMPEISFVVGTIVALQVGVWLHSRQPGATDSSRAKSAIGLVSAICCLLLGLTLHWRYSPFDFAEVSIPIWSFGGFLMSFYLFRTMWRVFTTGKTS
jgi:hypothetical protein